MRPWGGVKKCRWKQLWRLHAGNTKKLWRKIRRRTSRPRRIPGGGDGQADSENGGGVKVLKSTLKLVRRFVLVLILSLLGLLVLNIILFTNYIYDDIYNTSGWITAQRLGEELVSHTSGKFALTASGEELLQDSGAWAVLVDDSTGNVVWHSGNLPQEVPLHYSVAGISGATQGYIAGYPTTTAARGNDLVILGHPKDKYWKYSWNTWDYKTITNVPKTLLVIAGINLGVIFLIYMGATSGVLFSVKPIVRGIEALPEGGELYVRENGLLSELAAAINRVSEKLRVQERALKKRESARINWIAGVSHDIRTPLSMVMGYACQLEQDDALSQEERKKAEIIRLQSVRMKNLVNDLNLFSRLEYNMQPLKRGLVNLVSVARRSAVDFINMDTEEKYPVSWDTAEDLVSCMTQGDDRLLLRAVSNLIINAQVHNPMGCHISVCVKQEYGRAHIIVEDDGIGATDRQLAELKITPHYMMNDGSTKEPRHGLGLLIVRQIMAAHNGRVVFEHGKQGGFLADLIFFAVLNEENSSVK